jgi:phosphoglycolate phosphatase
MNGLPAPAALIFDWDNTLVDSWAIIHDAMNVMLPQLGHEPWPFEETRRRARKSLRDAFPALFGARWQEAQRIYLEAFEAIHLERLSPLPGAASLIAGLHAEGRYLAVVSNKTGAVLRKEVAALGWQHRFARLVGAGDAERDKPDRAPVDLALAGSEHSAGEAVWFIGDTDIDMVCARNAGCLPVLIHAEIADSEFDEVRPALHFSDCMALGRAIMATPACNDGRR